MSASWVIAAVVGAVKDSAIVVIEIFVCVLVDGWVVFLVGVCVVVGFRIVV